MSLKIPSRCQHYLTTNNCSSQFRVIDCKMTDESGTEDVMQVYIDSLESQIAYKRDFLRQVQDAIDSISAPAIPEGDWKELLEKPLYRPERSDPIGLCMASVSHTTRLHTTKKWIEHMDDSMPQVEGMIKDQREINHELEILIELLERKSVSMVSKIIPNASRTPEARNQQLWNELQDFVKNYLAVDMADPEDAGNDLFPDVFSLLKRLLRDDDTLKSTDFRHCSQGLYRLLLRGNLITVTKSQNGAKYVKLLDFANNDLS